MKIISDKRASVLRQIFRQMFVSRSTGANMNFQILVVLTAQVQKHMKMMLS